jgi:hypothetical protein
MDQQNMIAKIGDKKHALVFTVRALKAVNKKYGGIKQMTEAMDGDEGSEDVFTWLITLLANQGIEIENRNNGTHMPSITEDDVELMEPVWFKRACGKAMNAVTLGMTRELSDDSEEDEDEVLSEIKNAEGAAAE